MCAFMNLRNNGVFANSIPRFRSTVLREFVAREPTTAQFITSSSSTAAIPVATTPTAITSSSIIHAQTTTAAAAASDDAVDDTDGHDDANDESSFPVLVVDGRFAADPAAWRGQTNSGTTPPAVAATAAAPAAHADAAPQTMIPIIAPVAASTSTYARGTCRTPCSSPAACRRSVRCLWRREASFGIHTHTVGRESRRLSVQAVHPGNPGGTAQASCSSCKHRRHSRSPPPSRPFQCFSSLCGMWRALSTSGFLHQAVESRRCQVQMHTLYKRACW